MAGILPRQTRSPFIAANSNFVSRVWMSNSIVCANNNNSQQQQQQQQSRYYTMRVDAYRLYMYIYVSNKHTLDEQCSMNKQARRNWSLHIYTVYIHSIACCCSQYHLFIVVAVQNNYINSFVALHVEIYLHHWQQLQNVRFIYLF